MSPMDTAGQAILHTVSRFRDRANAFLAERMAREGVTGLAPSHGAILDALYRHGPQSMKAIGARVHRDKSTLTVLIRKLETQGYVRRAVDGNDARLARVSLTPKGKAFQKVFERISGELLDAVWGDAPLSQRADVERALTVMVERLER